MKVVNSVAELIGDTPLVKVRTLGDPNGAAVYVKLEYFNPSRSVKDRAAYQMLAEAEKSGELKPGATIIEPTSGNTGIGLAMNAAAKGYPAIFVMPDNSTIERIRLMRAYGAEVVLTPSKERMPGAIAKANEIAASIDNSFIPMQFENEANPDSHRHTTAVEIIESIQSIHRKLTAFVCTSGTGGTVTGTGESLRQHDPDITVHVVEPAGSPVLSGGQPGKHKLVGTSPGFIPPVLNTDVYDEIFRIEDDEAYQTVRDFARQEGVLLGPSGGASLFAALQVAKRLTTEDTVVCIAPDSGERYLSSDLFT
ncbi:MULTISPECIES: cysteine synthase A [Sporosarcina]|uniref:cysteine synthase A n=1 Tax=Sporosarcina TaxID=1569 RepID=UPI00129AEDF4|nr:MULTISPECIES: cysteine synthase A [Sporosarcina]GKV64743.1 putative cysteine synthase [Sporosarcina sp. NCCP-2331]GLB54853.1 putative cysteine synthase [Sporosarcina sp. NCCP-2378]